MSDRLNAVPMMPQQPLQHPLTPLRELLQRRAATLAECSFRVTEAFTAEPVLEIKGGLSREIRLLREKLHQGLKELRERSDFPAVLRGERELGRYLDRCAQVFARSEKLSAGEVLSSPLMIEATVTHLVAQYQLLRELGISRSVVANRCARFSVYEAFDRARRLRELFGKIPDGDRLIQTALARVFGGMYRTPDDAYTAYTTGLKACERSFVGPGIASLARTAAFQLFNQRYDNAADALQSLQALFREADLAFGSSEEMKAYARGAATAVFLGRAPSITSYKARFDLIHPQVQMLFGDSADTAPVICSATWAVLSGRHKSAKAAHAVYRNGLTAGFEIAQGEGADEGEDYVRTTAALFLDKTLTTVGSAKKRLHSVRQEVARVIQADRTLEDVAGMLRFALYARRITSIDTAVMRIKDALKAAQGVVQDDPEFPARTAAVLVLNNTLSSIEAARLRWNEVYPQCQKLFIAERASRFARTAAILCLMGRYASAQDARTAFEQCASESSRLVQDRKLPAEVCQTYLSLLFSKRPHAAAAVLRTGSTVAR